MSISLKPHNIVTYQKVTEKLNETKRTAVVHPTGTGKMYIALKLLEENKTKKAIYIAPSIPILHDVKKNIFDEGMTMEDFPNLKRITYQKLARLSDEEIQKLEADIIILDEFHHCGAPEWGKGVERLIERNNNASILGLSATPLRYNDGLRDMTDELFENNVASEMTVEEAIEEGILPSANYVSTLYGYEKELANIQQKIDTTKDIDKKAEAQKYLNELRKKLDENTQNLPELFAEHMQNKNGKYIVFCRNIDEMNEKIELAQKMFENVNSNITVRAVSSKIKESDKILTEFEQDTDEGTLKLLYAVDMINEGYHIKDLDGVVMMRPTFSPTVYTQQLGRALTVGGDKKPVVLDLVNNFDSCKIIEDFAEKMKEYKGKEKTEKKTKTRSSRISIFDKTKEFREIAEKITELTKRTKVTLEQKIEIFEKFSETGEEIVGSTIFEGYPIGQWAIQIRANLNKINNGKADRGIFNPTDEQLERLENLGILERQFDKTIDEKIDWLIEWKAKYPEIKIGKFKEIDENAIKRYASSNEEYEKLVEEYKKIVKYYEYIRYRNYQGKVDEKQFLRCKEGNLGGVFGYSSYRSELASKYNLPEKDIDNLLSKYGSIDNIYDIYSSGQNFKDEKEKKLINEIIKRNFTIEGSKRNYIKLLNDIFEDEVVRICSEEKLKECIDETLTSREGKIISIKYGLNDGIFKTFDETAKIYSEIGEYGYNLSIERVRQIILRTFRRIRHPERRKRYVIKRIDKEEIEENEKFDIDEKNNMYEIIKNIQLQNGDLIENLNEYKSIIEKAEKRELKARIIEDGIYTSELNKITYEDLIDMGIEPAKAELIIRNAEEEKRIEETEKDRLNRLDRYIGIEELELSVREWNALVRQEIRTVYDLSKLSKEELKKLKNIGSKSADAIVAKMKRYAFSYEDDWSVPVHKISITEYEKLKNDSKEDETNTDIEEIEQNNQEPEESDLESVTLEQLQQLEDKSEEISNQQENEEDEINTDVEEIEKNTQEPEESDLENMTLEQLQQLEKQNKEIIKNNEEAIKKEKIKIIKEQQKIIKEQQREIIELTRNKEKN